MIRLLFIRHGAIDGLGVRIAGRGSGIALNRAGRAQAARLGQRLRAAAPAAIYTSPQARTNETANALAAATNVPVYNLTALDELDFGDWTGCSYEALNRLPQWRAFNAVRSVTRIPNGELLLEVQNRIVACADRLRCQHDGHTIALVTHGDVIRAALAYYLGMPLDFILRVEISPASVTTLTLDDDGPRVLGVNHILPDTLEERDLDDAYNHVSA